MIAVLAPRHVLEWIERKAGCLLTVNAKGIAAIDDAGIVRGMIAYDNFTRGSCEVHIAIDTPFAMRALVPACFEYAFDQLKLNVTVGVTPGSNLQALALNKRLGFIEVHRVKDGWDIGVDMVVQELRPNNCFKWSKPNASRKL